MSSIGVREVCPSAPVVVVSGERSDVGIPKAGGSRVVVYLCGVRAERPFLMETVEEQTLRWGADQGYEVVETFEDGLADWKAEHRQELGDAVALLMDNCPRFLEVAWAAQRSGLYYTPLSSKLSAGEAEYILRDCGAISSIMR